MKHILLSLLVLFLMQFATAGDYSYVGVKKCKTCHKTSKIGNQFGIWQNGVHAKAFEVLKSAKAVEVAKAKGIADATKDPNCLKCHVTGHGATAAATLTQEEGISCEACHGPGSAYKKMSVMKDIAAGKVKGADFGMVADMEKQCVSCHNEESPTYKKFVFAERVKEISHPVPAK